MKKKISVLTATRAEYGLLRPLILSLAEETAFEVETVVTGAHLSPEFGLTYREIESDGISIARKIEILLSADTPSAVSKSMGLAMIGFADYFEQSRPDALLVLGDRYETLAVCCCAMNARIPIIHLYGGETTEGAIDEAVRHSITKMSYLHFTSAEEYRRRVIQLGESPRRVFTVGALGIENIMNMPLMGREELEKSLGTQLREPFGVVTFHPVTLENGSAERQFAEVLAALGQFPDLQLIFTKANADADGRIINSMIDRYASEHENVRAFESLGAKRYLSALKYASLVIGNSSSGILEAPSFHIPAVNIGNRQRGRLRAVSVIDCGACARDIAEAVSRALSPEFREKALSAENPYGDGNTSKKITGVIKEMLIDGDIDLRKKFYDIDFEPED